jgi:hypothetical protein
VNIVVNARDLQKQRAELLKENVELIQNQEAAHSEIVRLQEIIQGCAERRLSIGGTVHALDSILRDTGIDPGEESPEDLEKEGRND